jgi:tetratricopeptide (TPR) repeat protein
MSGIEVAASAIAKTVISELAKPALKRVRSRLQFRENRDAIQRAIYEAAESALTATAKAHADVTAELFDEHFLTHGAAGQLVRALDPDDAMTTSDLADRWAAQFGASAPPPTAITAACETFVHRYVGALRRSEALRPIFDSRALDDSARGIGQAVELLADIRGQMGAGAANPEVLAVELSSLPLVRELTWREAGVRQAGRECDDSGWTQKLKRPVDSKVEAHLRRWVAEPVVPGDALRQMVLVGPAGSGKTRSLFDAANTVCPNVRVLVADARFPERMPALVDVCLAELTEPTEPVLVWLDDLELHVPPDESGLTPALLERLRGAPRRVVVLATAGGKAAELAAARRASKGRGGSNTLLELVVETRHAEVTVGPRGLTKQVLGSSVAAGDLSEASAALIDRHGIGPYVLGTDLLARKFSTSAHHLSDATNPTGGTVARAGLLWAALGIVDGIGAKRLRSLAEKIGGRDLTARDFARAIEWAQLPVLSDIALLYSTEDGYRASDLLLDTVLESVTEQDCRAALSIASSREAVWIATTAARCAHLRKAVVDFDRDRQATSEESSGWFPFEVAMGHVYDAIGEFQKAEAAWEEGIEMGCPCSIRAAVEARTRDGDEEGVDQIYERALTAGQPMFAPVLADRRLRRSDARGAVSALEAGAALGDGRSAYYLASLLQSEMRMPRDAANTFRRALELGWAAGLVARLFGGSGRR